MIADSESPNEESKSENGEQTVQSHYRQLLALSFMRRGGLGAVRVSALPGSLYSS